MDAFDHLVPRMDIAFKSKLDYDGEKLSRTLSYGFIFSINSVGKFYLYLCNNFVKETVV